MSHVLLKLTPRQARILWNIIDGVQDAGACEDGNTPEEARALESIMTKLLAQHNKWKRKK